MSFSCNQLTAHPQRPSMVEANRDSIMRHGRTKIQVIYTEFFVGMIRQKYLPSGALAFTEYVLCCLL